MEKNYEKLKGSLSKLNKKGQTMDDFDTKFVFVSVD
jgi:hypothetical protein